MTVCQTRLVHQDVVAQIHLEQHSIDRVAAVFKLLADETRLKIVFALSRHELCVCDLTAILGSTQSNISHHLRLLRNARLVKCRREGKMIFYALDDEHVEAMINQGFAHVAHS